MFRVTRYMHELLEPTPLRPQRPPPGPVVIWNLITTGPGGARCGAAGVGCRSSSM